MLVSCICPTYDRKRTGHVHLVEEAIESFLRQDWPDKELVVLNDAVGQELVCNMTGVRVTNLDFRLPSLGAKYNLLVYLSRGECICPWEDDDISLPWRISTSIECIGEADYYNPQRYYFLDGAGMHVEHAMGVSHNCSMYRKSAWGKVGGYSPCSGAQDAALDAALKASVVTVNDPLLLEKWYYIYRWGVQPHHLSGYGDGSDDFYAANGDYDPEPGVVHLRPHWRDDYVAMCLAKRETDHAHHN